MSWTLLDGPMGTELERRGVDTSGAAWSATAIDTAPDVIRQIHRDYLVAGAQVHTANTFRTHARNVGPRWWELAQRAVELAREAAPTPLRLAASMAPLGDCYRPDQTPADPRPEHRAMAQALKDTSADLILCEAFSNVREGLVALDEALSTGRPAWLSFTPGPDGTLLTPNEVGAAAAHAWALGAECVLVNCVELARARPYVEALADAAAGARFGVYANGGPAENPATVQAYVQAAAEWIAAGASVVGGCCYTRPEHIAALARM